MTRVRVIWQSSKASQAFKASLWPVHTFETSMLWDHDMPPWLSALPTCFLALNPSNQRYSRRSRQFWWNHLPVPPDPKKACSALTCNRLHADSVSYNRHQVISILILYCLSNSPLVLWLASSMGLDRHSVRKLSSYKCNAWYRQNAGKVDICPCPGITFHQKKIQIDC